MFCFFFLHSCNLLWHLILLCGLYILKLLYQEVILYEWLSDCCLLMCSTWFVQPVCVCTMYVYHLYIQQHRLQRFNIFFMGLNNVNQINKSSRWFLCVLSAFDQHIGVDQFRREWNSFLISSFFFFWFICLHIFINSRQLNMFNLNEKILFSDSVVSYSFYAKCFVCE